jgi:hypothetical protein
MVGWKLAFEVQVPPQKIVLPGLLTTPAVLKFTSCTVRSVAPAPLEMPWNPAPSKSATPVTVMWPCWLRAPAPTFCRRSPLIVPRTL